MPIGNAHSPMPTMAMRSRRPWLKRAWAGGGVSSSMTAGSLELPALPCPPPAANSEGARRPPMTPISAAPSTMAGKGRLKAKSATKAAAAIAHSAAFFSVRLPMRQAAWMTMAVTAGLIP